VAYILVVDDDLVYLDELTNGLRALGHEAETATSGSEAFSVLKTDTFDLVICDMIMAGGGALSFLHEVRAILPNLPVIVITGQREIANSPLFRDGMREASAKIEKSASLLDIDRVIRSLLY